LDKDGEYTKQIVDLLYDLPQEDIVDVKDRKNAESVVYIREIIVGFSEKMVENLHSGRTDQQTI
jgi:hypothetical protein